MVNCLTKMIKELDSFGKPINFNIEGKETYKTVCGGCLNIIVVIIFIIHFIFALVITNDPDIGYFDIENENRELKIPLTKFLFSVSLFKLNELKHENISDYFDMVIAYIEKNKDPKLFPLKPCNLTEYSENFIGKLDDFSYCPDFGKYKNETITLSSKEHDEKFLFLKVYKKNTPSRKYKKNITEFLEREDEIFFLKLKHNVQLFNPENKTEPMRHSLQADGILLSLNKENIIYLKYEKSIVETVWWKLLDRKFENSYIGTKQIEGDVRFVKENSMHRSYLTAIFFPNSINRKYVRNYPFFDDYIGDATVLSTWVSFVFSFLYAYYCDFKYNSFLFRKLAINSFEDLDKDDDSNTNSKKNSFISGMFDISKFLNDMNNDKIMRKYTNDNINRNNSNISAISNNDNDNKERARKNLKKKSSKNKKDQKKENLINEEFHSNSIEETIANEKEKELKANETNNISGNSIPRLSLKNLQEEDEKPKEFNSNNNNNNKEIIKYEIKDSKEAEINNNKKVINIIEGNNKINNDINSSDFPSDSKSKENLYSEENDNENDNDNDIENEMTEKINLDNLENSDIKSAFENLEIKKRKINISYLGYFFSSCFGKKRRNRYRAIDEFSNKFEEKFDIFYYFKRNKNINLMKKLTLNKEQVNYIDLLSEKYLFKFKENKEEKRRIKKSFVRQDTKELRSSLQEFSSKGDQKNKQILEMIFKKQIDS